MFKFIRARDLFTVKVKQAGFTLVELLVVIGIIAILAGVALGPISRALKTAGYSKGMQTARTLALAEFQYSNDNSQVYPDKSNPGANGKTDASLVGAALMAGGYVTDAGVFVISGSIESKMTGSPSTSYASFGTSNCSFDFMGSSAGTGVNSNAPDFLPVVWSSITGGTVPTWTSATKQSATPLSTNPFGTAGVAVCYKCNSALFVTATGTTTAINDSTYLGWPQAHVLAGGG
jgi:prepilin-type N-terminal cleavage/methylation domain-containing protein